MVLLPNQNIKVCVHSDGMGYSLQLGITARKSVWFSIWPALIHICVFPAQALMLSAQFKLKGISVFSFH